MPERFPQFAWTGPSTTVGELLGSDTDLATNGNSEKAAGNEPIDHRAIESEVAEQVAEQEVDRFAVGGATSTNARTLSRSLRRLGRFVRE